MTEDQELMIKLITKISKAGADGNNAELLRLGMDLINRVKSNFSEDRNFLVFVVTMMKFNLDNKVATGDTEDYDADARYALKQLQAVINKILNEETS